MNKHPLANCEFCPLNETGTYVAPTEHYTYNDVAFVTSQPFPSETFSGGFFNSKAGELVQKVMSHHNLDDYNVSHHYAVACRPQEGQKVSAPAINACRPRLIDELNKSLAKGATVVALGGEPTLAVGVSGGVLAARVGPPRAASFGPYRVIATVSPYLCMKQQQNFPSLVTDIGKIANPIIEFIEPEYALADNPFSLVNYLSTCIEIASEKTSRLVVDIECVIDKETSFGHPENYEMLCIGIKFNEDTIVVITSDALTFEVYQKLSMLMGFCINIFHNGKFDLNGMRPHVGRQRIGRDTMLASYVFDERAGAGNFHGLKYLAQEFLGAPPYDDVLEQYIGTGQNKDFSKAPKDILYKYNAFDVQCTYLLDRMYEEKFASSGEELTSLYRHLLNASDTLMDLEYSGIAVDEGYLDELSEKLTNDTEYKEYQLSLAAFKIRKEGYDPKRGGINPNSPIQVKKFFNDCGISLDSTDEETLTKIIEYNKDFPNHDAIIRRFAKRLLAYRGEKKLKTTYVDGIRTRAYKGRVHSSYLLHGTTTGRLSSRNPNLQNIPRSSPIKKLFIASNPDNVIVNVDYSQAELRVMTWLAKEPYFQEIFNDPTRDVFDELVPELFPGANKELDDPKEFKEKRTMVKTYVYGLGYGRTEYGIARGFGIPVEVAKLHKKRFFSTIPEIIKWQNRIKQQVASGKDLVTPYGRHRRYSLITDENERDIMNESLAFMPQSIASDMCLTAANWVNDEFHENDQDAHIVNLVHDAIMFECHKDSAEMLAQYVSDMMIESAQAIVGDYVKFATDYSYDYTWGNIK